MMTEQLPLILGAGTALIIVAVLLWWFSRRMTGPLKTLLRLVTLVAVIALIGLGSAPIVSSQLNSSATAETLIVPAETMTVSTGDLAVTLTAAGSLLPANEKVLNFTTSAPVLEVLVQPGDIVAAGDVLARMDTTDIEAQIVSAEMSLTEAQAARDALLAPVRDIDIEIAETSVEAAMASLSSSAQGNSATDVEIARLQTELAKNQLWQTQVNRDTRLEANPEFRGQNAYANEVTTNAGVENQELSVQSSAAEYEATVNENPNASSLASANAQLESAQAGLESLLNGPSATELRKVDIDVENAQLNLEDARRALDEAVLTAPFAGVVATQNLMVGTLPPTDEAAMTLIDLSQYTVSLSIDETDIVELALGQKVNLDIQALDTAAVTGKITYIDLAPTASGELVTYIAEVTLDPTNAALRPGMSVVASVVLEALNDVITVPNRYIQTDPTTQQTVVMVQTAPGIYQAVPVTLGLRTLENSQIVRGISVGQTIVILSNDEGDIATDSGLSIPGLPGSGGGGGGGRPQGGF